MKLVINRKEWRRGPLEPEVAKNDPTALLCKDGTKCCLGFYALQCGYTPDRILGLGEPEEVGMPNEDVSLNFQKVARVWEDEDEYTGGVVLRMTNTDLAGDAININDARYENEADREHDLIKRFAKEGIEVEFV